jgi:hypothetical protein
MKRLVLAGIVATALGASALPAGASVAVSVGVGIAPPPAPIYEVVPAPRYGWGWVPGYWAWGGHQHVWVQGHWVKRRPVYAYAPVRYYRYY